MFCAQAGREHVDAALVGNRRETIRGGLPGEWLDHGAAVVPADKDRPNLRVDMPAAWQGVLPGDAPLPTLVRHSNHVGCPNRKAAPQRRLALLGPEPAPPPPP